MAAQIAIVENTTIASRTAVIFKYFIIISMSFCRVADGF
jgi:hypothetical protein